MDAQHVEDLTCGDGASGVPDEGFERFERQAQDAGAAKAVVLSVMVAGWVLATTVIAGAGRTLGRGGPGA
ncbi:hypothetical protein Ait01nite_012990 [Actinoplanes italicus]|nr:hypothetical protein Ait01nite_012990 [Actinoplanes italicus]